MGNVLEDIMHEREDAEKHLYMITYASFDEDGHTKDSVDELDDYADYTPEEMAQQCANFLSQTDDAWVGEYDSVYEEYDGIDQLFCMYTETTREDAMRIQQKFDEKNSGIEHYKGKLGEFDYDKSKFRIYEGETEHFLGYIGNSTDGKDIEIPEGIVDCHRMFWSTQLKSIPTLPDSANKDPEAVRTMLGKYNCERLLTSSQKSRRKNPNTLDRSIETVDSELGVDGLTNVNDFNNQKGE